jgi:hypothetical protein
MIFGRKRTFDSDSINSDLLPLSSILTGGSRREIADSHLNQREAALNSISACLKAVTLGLASGYAAGCPG